MANIVDSNIIRREFSQNMAAMYREEVPQYGVLLDIARDVNARSLGNTAGNAGNNAGLAVNLESLTQERHGAIRLGKPAELAMMRRFFAALGMYPVGYYDLAPAGIPVHSTAFRPLDRAAMDISPFRMFCSLLRLDLIQDASLRKSAMEVLEKRNIFSAELTALIVKSEADGGLTPNDARQLVALGSDVFRWHSSATVDATTYEALRAQHPLIADVVCFKGPHINHLTPRVLDIEAAQQEMPRRNIAPKDFIEGPPKRIAPILLRQTSFKAIAEDIYFPGQASGTKGAHKARFGEIEERGCALTPKGRVLYDRCLAQARAAGGTYDAALKTAFADFPDDWDIMRRQGLAYFRFGAGRQNAGGRPAARAENTLEGALDDGTVVAEPITYEDFLPVSAAGIFQSNLGQEARSTAYEEASAQDQFEAILGCKVTDPFALYAQEQSASLAQLGLTD